MSSLRIKVQFGNDSKNDFPFDNIKFVYVIESPSQKTIHELIRMLQKYIREEFNDNTQIVQLKTHDGFLLSKSALCSTVLRDNEHIMCIDMQTFTEENIATIDFDNLWFELKQHDASDNEEKAIQIGLNNFSKLFIRMYSAVNNQGLYIFTINELINIANEKRQGNFLVNVFYRVLKELPN